ncbi:hypothetical protein POK33_29490 [Burkholderia cenocepacia]|uniref:hypothetical protein n=1 Tax=Burkholderia cenocepacia TaxID=95486 RepID=UPI0023B9E359|nr:hypothetical protein [Burkholderia cenocepacia]MDF0504873.1 hypothetical protein [Burkholderia cenocepacia]
MTDKIALIERRIGNVENYIAHYAKRLELLKEELKKARTINPEDIVPGAKFYQKRKLYTAVKTVIQYGDSERFSLMGVDRNEYKLGAEAYQWQIPHCKSAAEVAAWLVRDGWTKERPQ